MDQVRPIVDIIESIYRYMIIAYILLSWLPRARESFFGVLLGKFVEPYLGLFRRFIPTIGGVLDLSPLVALFVLPFVAYGLVGVLDFFF